MYIGARALDRFLTMGAKVLRIFVLKERKFHGNESSRERSLPSNESSTGANVPWNESSAGKKVPSVDFLLPGTKVQRKEKSDIPKMCHFWDENLKTGANPCL